MPFNQCISELQQGLGLSQQYGCEPQYVKLLSCANDFGFTCQPGQNDPIVHPSCEPAVDQFQQCIEGGGSCAYSGGPGS
jgi:hypothetical protein